MPNKDEVNQRVKEDLEYEFVSKKRLSIPHYNYISTHAGDAHFCEAAKLCEESELHPAQYIEIMWERMGDKKEFFGTSHLRGPGAKKAIAEYFEDGDNYNVEITNANLEYNDLWNYQKELAMRYMRNGRTIKSILMDSSLKFFAWFRILVTEEKDDEIIKKYKHIAKKEFNSGLLDFAKQHNLEINRILD